MCALDMGPGPGSMCLLLVYLPEKITSSFLTNSCFLLKKKKNSKKRKGKKTIRKKRKRKGEMANNISLSTLNIIMRI